MMEYALKKYFKVSINGFALCAGSLLGGCGQPPVAVDAQGSSASEAVSGVNAHISSEAKQTSRGKKLAEVAGQATFKAEQPNLSAKEMPEPAKVYTGRYHASIPCDDGFIPCQTGSAEFILNLLPDGTVHRSIIHYGKIFTDKPITEGGNTAYRKDMWAFDEADHEIIVRRQEGVNFYYIIQDRNHLIMNLEKIRNDTDGKNQEMFKNGYPTPARAYVLTRDKDAQ